MQSQSTRVCSIDGCDGPLEGRGWCNTHYTRWRKYGDPLRVQRVRAPHGVNEATRFWYHVDKEGPTVRPEIGPCWVWTGAKLAGYGVFMTAAAKTIRAARYSLALSGVEMADGIEACHRCDNPPCVNNGVDSPYPSHLFAGTRQANSADMAAKKRSAWGERNPTATLTDAEVLQIRALSGEMTRAALGRMFGVTVSVIGNVVTRKTWRNLP